MKYYSYHINKLDRPTSIRQRPWQYLLSTGAILSSAISWLLFAPAAGANLCTAAGGTVGTNLFNNDGSFGTGSSTAGTTGSALPAGRTTYTHINYGSSAPNDGYYSIVNRLNQTTFNYWFNPVSGHTTGAVNDQMMVVNAAHAPGTFYTETLTVPANQTMYFRFWILNLPNPSSSGWANFGGTAGNPNIIGNNIKPNVSLYVNRIGIDDNNNGTIDETGEGQLVTSTGAIPFTSAATWVEYGTLFNTGNAAQIEFRLINNAPGGLGNDLALDDFLVAPCTPLPSGNITGTLYRDTNNNNVYNSGTDTTMPANIAIDLKDSNGIIIATAYTDSNGGYTFTNIFAGSNYTLAVALTDSDIPTGLTPTANPSGASTTGIQTGITIADATTLGNQNFGFSPPDLTITKTHTGNFTRGQTGATYTLTATNSGTGATSGTVTVVDTIPTGLTATAASGTGWTCTLNSPSAGQVQCTRTNALAAGSSYPPITLTVTVASNAGASLTNNVAVSGGGELNTTNNTAADATTINISDLTITKTHTGNFTRGQTGATYTLTATNSGTGATSGTVTVVDTIPTGLTATAASGTGWTCTLNSPSAGQVQCTRTNALAAGSSYPPITLTVTVASNAGASLTNNVAVSGGGELNTTNNTAADATTINISDLTITKTHTGNFTRGQTGATYTLTATNSGTGATSGTVTVVDTIPTGLTATAASGSGWACTLNTPSTGQVQCTRTNTLAAGSSYPPITLTVTVASNAGASLTNNVAISGGSELNTTNNTAADATTINISDLTITKTHTGNFTRGQTGATYTLTATNSGTGATSGTVTVVDTIPTGLTATAASGTGWTCTLNSPTAGQVQCTRTNALAAGSSYPPITLTVTVASNAGASLTNNVTISGGGELNTANNTAADVTTVTSSANVLLVKRITAINNTQLTQIVDNLDTNDPTNANDNHANWPSNFLAGAIDGGTVKPGDNIEYTIYFLNAGGNNAKQVRICDRIIGAQTLSGTTIQLHKGDGTTDFTTVSTLTTGADGDRATYYSDITTITGAKCNFKTTPTANNGAIVVDVDGTSSPAWSKLMGSSAPGTINSYGFIRFTTTVTP